MVTKKLLYIFYILIQYFYPDGGWGWIICGIAFLVHILTTGLQLSSSLLLFYAIEHLRDSNGIGKILVSC